MKKVRLRLPATSANLGPKDHPSQETKGICRVHRGMDTIVANALGIHWGAYEQNKAVVGLGTVAGESGIPVTAACVKSAGCAGGS